MEIEVAPIVENIVKFCLSWFEWVIEQLEALLFKPNQMACSTNSNMNHTHGRSGLGNELDMMLNWSLCCQNVDEPSEQSRIGLVQIRGGLESVKNSKCEIWWYKPRCLSNDTIRHV